MLKEIENNNLPDMAIPNNLLESGKKSFTLPVPSGTDADSSAKGIGVKFYPHPGKKNVNFFVAQWYLATISIYRMHPS